MTEPRRLEGKVAIVTGASAGIGAAVAHRSVAPSALASSPATSRMWPPRARRWRRRTIGAGRRFVNNAGIDHTGPVLETALSEVREVFETNFFGALSMLQAAGRTMADRGGGTIVNVTSRLASIGVPTMVLYGASKGALLALTRGAAVELAPLGIRVNAVAPGQTRTPLTEAWLAEQGGQAGEDAVAGIPQGRFGEPDEVAAAVAFLAADESAHITGASIPVDGGYTAA